MRNFISTNRHLFWILSISLLLLALDVAADYFVTSEPRLDELLDFSRPTHLDRDVSIREGTRYWIRIEFSKTGLLLHDSDKTSSDGDTYSIAYVSSLSLQKTGESGQVVDENPERKIYFLGHRPQSTLLARPDLEFGRYHLHLDLPAMPQLASEKAHLTLTPDPKGPWSPQLGAVHIGYAFLAFVVAPIDFIVLILLGVRGLAAILRLKQARLRGDVA